MSRSFYTTDEALRRIKEALSDGDAVAFLLDALRGGKVGSWIHDEKTGKLAQLKAALWWKGKSSKEFRYYLEADKPGEAMYRKEAYYTEADWVTYVGTLQIDGEGLARLLAVATATLDSPPPEEPATQQDSPQDVPTPKKIKDKRESEKWYRKRVKDAVEKGIRHSREKDEEAGREIGLSRKRVRELRKKLAPPEWQGHGRRKMSEK